MTERNIIIQAIELHKSFGTLKILKGISLSVYKKEIVAVVGASGAGKTTLLQILSTLDQADTGEVIIAGQEISRLDRDKQAEIRNKKIGFVFQSHQLLPEFTAQENVAIPAMIAGIKQKEAMLRADKLLTQLSLKKRLTHKPAAMSGGEKQRVAVARALINNPEIIFADEPTGALDSERKEELYQIFQQLRCEHGHTFIIVSHDPSIEKIADRTIYLQDGIITD